MKSNQLSGVFVAALFSLQAGLAWSATDPTPSAKSQSKQPRKVLASKKAPPAKIETQVAPTPVVSLPSGNPYLQAVPVAQVKVNSVPYQSNATYPSSNPYLAYTQPTQQDTPSNPASDAFGKLGAALPSFGSSAESLLPSIKKVYPTGEKPLVVVNFKCPIEMAGVKGGPTKILHDVVDLGMNAVNSTNLLSFNLQQVCQ